jgi:hypothetical protein
MSLTDHKIEPGDYIGQDIMGLPDQVVGDAAALKARFDALVKQVLVPKINGLIDDIVSITDGASGADSVGATALKEGGAESVQGALEELAPCGIRYRLAANQTLPSGGTNYALFDTEEHRFGEAAPAYTAPGEFTIVTPGIYRITASVGFNGQGGTGNRRVFIGRYDAGGSSLGLIADTREVSANTGARTILNISTEYAFDAGVVIKVGAIQSSGSVISIESSGSSFVCITKIWSL